jgi:Ca2+-binding EF-hand superfamily protein
MSDEQIERMVTDKMREQWRTMKKAFSELSKERLGHITLKELQT